MTFVKKIFIILLFISLFCFWVYGDTHDAEYYRNKISEFENQISVDIDTIEVLFEDINNNNELNQSIKNELLNKLKILLKAEYNKKVDIFESNSSIDKDAIIDIKNFIEKIIICKLDDEDRNEILNKLNNLLKNKYDAYFNSQIILFRGFLKNEETLNKLRILKSEIIDSNLNPDRKNIFITNIDMMSNNVLISIFNNKIQLYKENINGLQSLINEILNSSLSNEEKIEFINRINFNLQDMLYEDYKNRINNYKYNIKDKKLINQWISLKDEIMESVLNTDKKNLLILIVDENIKTTTEIVYTDIINQYANIKATEDLIETLKNLISEINNHSIAQEIKDKLLINLNNKVRTVEEEIIEDKIELFKKSKATEETISELEDFKTTVKDSTLWQSTKQYVLGQIDDLIKSFKKEINGGIIEINKNNIIKETKIIFDKGEAYLKLPYIGTLHEFSYVIKNNTTGDMLVNGRIKEGNVKLPFVSKGTKIEAYISIVNTETFIEVENIIITAEIIDREKPVLDYAYVKDSILYFDYSDNYYLKEEAFGYKYSNETKYVYTSHKFVSVEIPSKINIIIEDEYGNTNTMTLDIKEDNAAITKNMPSVALKELYGGKIIIFDEYKNLVMAEKDTKVNISDIFKEYIKEGFNVENNNNFIISEKMDKDGFYSLNKEGLIEFVIKDKEEKEIRVYIFSVDFNIKSNIENISPKNNIEKIEETEILLTDYIDIETTDGKIKEAYLLIIDYKKNEIYPITQKVKFDKNKANEYNVLDILSGNIYDLLIEENEEEKSDKEIAVIDGNNKTNGIYDKDGNNKSNGTFTDVINNYWASNMINSLAEDGLIVGYPDKTFRPENNITVREFNIILSRYMNKISNNNVKEKAQDLQIDLDESASGYTENLNVLNRINIDKIKEFDIKNLDRQAKRDEIAYLIANTINIEIANFNKTLNDIKNNRYMLEIMFLLNADILKGYPDKSYKPANEITRAEITSIFFNMIAN